MQLSTNKRFFSITFTKRAIVCFDGLLNDQAQRYPSFGLYNFKEPAECKKTYKKNSIQLSLKSYPVWVTLYFYGRWCVRLCWGVCGGVCVWVCVWGGILGNFHPFGLFFFLVKFWKGIDYTPHYNKGDRPPLSPDSASETQYSTIYL